VKRQRRQRDLSRPDERGFTLIELMISLVIFSFAVAGVLAVAVSMSQGLHEQRAAVEAESAARVPLDFIQDALRQASPGAPTLNIYDVNTCSTSALTITDNYASSAPDYLDVIYASGAVVTSLRTTYTTGTTSVTVTDASQLAINDYIVISDTTQGHFVQITGITGNNLTLASQACAGVFPSGGYSPGALVIRAQHALFFIGSVPNGTLPPVPTLMMNNALAASTADTSAANLAGGQPLAEGVEDLQLVQAWDTGAGVGAEVGTAANDDNWQGNFPGAAENQLTGTLRAVRVTLTARTTSAYIGAATAFIRPAAENHAAATAGDSFRRRVLRTTVEVRNVGTSP
jgi:prepilin-type N-terminal cleavage/methylation domain-containing protein